MHLVDHFERDHAVTLMLDGVKTYAFDGNRSMMNVSQS